MIWYVVILICVNLSFSALKWMYPLAVFKQPKVDHLQPSHSINCISVSLVQGATNGRTLRQELESS